MGKDTNYRVIGCLLGKQ